MSSQNSDSGEKEEQEISQVQRSDPEDRGVLQPSGEDSDFLLDIPGLHIEELHLEVEDLRAHVSASAEVADFVKINVGVDAYLNQLKLDVKGIEAQVALKVGLERVLGTIERALSIIEDNPGVLDPRSRGPSSRETGGVRATDAARRRAKELQVDLSAVEGTGSGGRILLRDVRRAANEGV